MPPSWFCLTTSESRQPQRQVENISLALTTLLFNLRLRSGIEKRGGRSQKRFRAIPGSDSSINVRLDNLPVGCFFFSFSSLESLMRAGVVHLIDAGRLSSPIPV